MTVEAGQGLLAFPMLVGVLVLAAVAVALLVLLLLRRPPDLAQALQESDARHAAATERLVRGLREEFVAQSRQALAKATRPRASRSSNGPTGRTTSG